jgi:hypothetical protein
MKVLWIELLGRQLRTATGAPFKVVRVSTTHVAVRPQRGTRDYALSISKELEPAVAVYVAGNLPAPAELAHLGIRPVLLSYAWGILKAVVQDKIGVRAVRRAKPRDFAGTWFITSMEEMGDDYWAAEDEEAVIRLQVSRYGNGLNGEYVIGLSSGGIDGDLREFGGETVVIFGYDGVDEMDPTSGGGWLQLLDAPRGTLEGEFMGALGPFTARRQGAQRKRPRQTDARPKRRQR